MDKNVCRINVNEMVSVKLTPKGYDILRNHIKKEQEMIKKYTGDLSLISNCEKLILSKIDDSGYYTDQLWCIMNIFGGYFVNGMDIPFEYNNIFINEKYIKKNNVCQDYKILVGRIYTHIPTKNKFIVNSIGDQKIFVESLYSDIVGHRPAYDFTIDEFYKNFKPDIITTKDKNSDSYVDLAVHGYRTEDDGIYIKTIKLEP